MITETEAARTNFADALEKVRLLGEARQQVEKLETFVRNERMRLAHAASKASNEHDRAQLRQQSQRLARGLMGLAY
jgi:hypothetical protein